MQGGIIKMPNQKTMSNIKLYDGYITVSVNPKIYPLEIVYSASYVLLDKAYVMIDGDPAKEIIIELRPKDKANQSRFLAKLSSVRNLARRHICWLLKCSC